MPSRKYRFVHWCHKGNTIHVKNVLVAYRK
jgi:hypothetical protein